MAQKNTKKTARVANKKTAKQVLPFRLPELPLPLARAIIFVLFFANIGVAYLLFSQAATYNVRFVLFCATDSCSGSTTTLDGYGGQVRSWYGSKLGKTFNRLSTVKVTGSHNAAYYSGGSRSDTTKTYYSVYDDLKAKGYISSYTKVVVQLGFRSMANCGVGSYDGPLAITDPFKGCSSVQPSVLAHELGHNLKLAYNGGNMHRTDGTLMHAPLACNGATLSSCSLNSSDRSWLLGNRAYWFPTSTSSTSTSTTTTSPYVESSSDPYRASCSTPTHQTLKQGSSGNCVKHLQWLLINKWSTHGGSYVSNSGGVDGGFGSGTTQAVKTFQSYKGLTADGVVGPKTWDALH